MSETLRILVTGSNGLLGQKLIKLLKTRKGIDFLATSKGENRNSSLPKKNFRELDITDAETAASVISDYQPDCIINTAAMTQVDACEEKPQECSQINAVGVANLIKASDKKTHIIQLSTDFVFDGLRGPYHEGDKPNPVNFYGKSKWAAENLLEESGRPWAVLRTILVYGVVPNLSRTNIVLWVKDSLEENKNIRVVKDQIRMPTLAEDLAQACVAAAQKKAKGIYHISGNESMSILDLAYKVADFFELDKNLIQPAASADLQEPAKRPPKTGFVLDKAARDLNFRPTSFEQGLALVKNSCLV